MTGEKKENTKKPNQSLVTLLPTGHQIFADILSIQDTGRTIVQHFRNTKRILHHFYREVSFWDSWIKKKKKVIPKWTWTKINSDGIKNTGFQEHWKKLSVPRHPPVGLPIVRESIYSQFMAPNVSLSIKIVLVYTSVNKSVTNKNIWNKPFQNTVDNHFP